MTVSEQLREAITASNFTVNSLGIASGVPQSCLHRFLYGQQSMTLRNVDKLAAYLGLSLGRTK